MENTQAEVQTQSNTKSVTKPVTKATRRHKPKPVKRSSNSFRPGGTPEVTILKALKFVVPCDEGISNDQEMTRVRDLAVQLSQAAGLGVNAVGIKNEAWEIVLTLSSAEKDHDKLLNDTFRAVDSVVVASEVLKTGFVKNAKAKWQFCIDDFVADEGGF